MDSKTFDAFTKNLAHGKSRRAVLCGLVGGGAAVIAAKTGSSLAGPGQGVVASLRYLWPRDPFTDSSC